MTSRPLTLIATVVLAAASMAAAIQDVKPPDADAPVLRVPQMAKAPTLDGQAGEDEWAGAAKFTGVSGNPLGTPFLLPQTQQVQWLIGFRDNMIYIAMRSPHPPGTFPVGRIKDRDDPDVLWGDHVEIEISPHGREKPFVPGQGFYMLIVNAWGAMHDQHVRNGTPGTEALWDTGGEVKCHVTDRMWQMELSIDARRMGVTKLDGHEFIMQFTRADEPSGGVFFAGWVGSAWMGWNKFGAVTFDSSAPTVQISKLGEPMAGELDAAVTVAGSANAKDKPQDVQVRLTVEDADGKVLYEQAESATVAAGQRKQLTFAKSGLAVSDVAIAEARRNRLTIQAVWKDGKTERTVYLNRSGFMKMTPQWRAKFLDPWLQARPQAGKCDAVFANLPYAGKAQAKVDVDFFGMAKEIRETASFRVEVRPARGGDVLAKAQAEMNERGFGEAFFDLPDLADGNYIAAFTLYAKDGKTKVAERAIEFPRRHYPWEHNTLGQSDEVIPPFEPMELNAPKLPDGPGAPPPDKANPQADRIFAWGRVIQPGASGLPEQVWATPPTGTCGRLEPLLAAPIRLEMSAGGKTLEMKADGKPAVKVQMHRADVTGQAAIGPVRVTTTAFEEYDGWYQAELKLSPEGAAPVTADSLDLLIDLRDAAGDRWNPVMPADTLYVQRLGAGMDSYYDAIPRKPGVHFTSDTLPPPTARGGKTDLPKDWKGFVPITYAGNGDRGLWLFCWSDAGWTLKDKDPALRVERLADGTVRLRVRIIAGPDKLEAPRTIRFALQPAPVKRNRPDYRRADEGILHDTSGYRYYGKSVDDFVLDTDKDFDALRKYILYGPRYQVGDKLYNHWTGRASVLREGYADRVLMYGSQWMTGLGPEEFDTFGGEWVGQTNWKPHPDTKFAGRWNYGHTVQWLTARQMTPARVNWPTSFQDYAVWYHQKLIDKSGFNGTWWDNCYGGLVTEYDPELGRLDSKWNLIYRRQLCKRLNVIGWEHMRPPCWAMNTEVEMSWCQLFWMVEGAWGQEAPGMTALATYPSLGWFRSQCRTKSTVMPAKRSYITHFKGNTPESDRRAKRSADALLLSHDVPPVFADETIHKLKYVVDYLDSDHCLFAGYWATGAFIAPSESAIRASIYQNATRKAAVIVFLNTDPKDKYLGGTSFNPAGVVMTPSLVPAEADKAVNVKRVYDLETGKDVKVSFRDGRLVIDEALVVDGHGYRLLAVEVE